VQHDPHWHSRLWQDVMRGIRRRPPPQTDLAPLLWSSTPETLTIHRLHVPTRLRLTLFSTNPIESALSVVEQKCGRVKKWQAAT